MNRPCGCPVDAPGHAEIEPDWIGNAPIMHGESDRRESATSQSISGAYCLCGHPDYVMCPAYLGTSDDAWGGGVLDLEIGP